MQICGIVAEYNPFHNGHAHHIAQTRRILGQDTAIVCCMSGNWVQRGEAALAPKHLRAEAALCAGADLVFELPAAYALQSAEGFAQSAVYLLSALGALTHLSFGAEHNDLGDLWDIAHTLLEHRTVQETLTQLKTGISYAAARERALYSLIQERAAIIQHPNNILAVEYLKALIRQGSSLQPIVIARAGAGHDSAQPVATYASASYLRAALRADAGADMRALMPPASGEILGRAMRHGHALLNTERLEAAMLPHLLRLTPEALARLSGSAEGLEHRLHSAIAQGGSLAQIISAAKTRRYPEARIRRMLTCAYLDISAADIAQPIPYARVLGATARGRQVLRAAAKETAIPIITKAAHVKQLSERAVAAFRQEALAADLFHLALPAWRDFHPGSDWQAGIVLNHAENMG